MFASMIKLVAKAPKRFVVRAVSSASATNNKQLDPQDEAMLNEQCFLVDENDIVTGQASKRDCHLVQEDGNIPLHRAFSVFLFNQNGDLLLQKRASEKV